MDKVPTNHVEIGERKPWTSPAVIMATSFDETAGSVYAQTAEIPEDNLGSTS